MEIDVHFICKCPFLEQRISQPGALRNKPYFCITKSDDLSSSKLGSWALHVLNMGDIHWRGFPKCYFHNQINIGDFPYICVETFYPEVEHSNSTTYK